MNTVSIHPVDSLDAKKRSCGLPKGITIYSTSTLFVLLRNILTKKYYKSSKLGQYLSNPLGEESRGCMDNPLCEA